MRTANAIKLPLVRVLFLGLVQLLPFGSADSALPLKISTTLSLDPYATRFFLSRLLLCMIFVAGVLPFLNSLATLRTLAFVFIVFLTLMAFFSILQRVELPGSIYGLRAPARAPPFRTFINPYPL